MYPQNGLIRALRRSKAADCAGCSERVPPPVDVPQMPATALAQEASRLGLTAPPWAESRDPGHEEHEKKTFFS